MKPANVIGPQICRLRKERHWTQRDLAEKLQKRGHPITRDMLACWETRRSAVPDASVAALAAVFHVSINELFPEQPPIPVRRPNATIARGFGRSYL